MAAFEVQQTEKIEELYLYMFEMNERLKVLEEKVTDLEEENSELRNQLESQNK